MTEGKIPRNPLVFIRFQTDTFKIVRCVHIFWDLSTFALSDNLMHTESVRLIFFPPIFQI